MPKNMKYDAVATKAAGPKKKMKTNQDGGSVTAKDPAAAGKQLMADQKAGGARMGYSQKFGPGRMNGYDAGAKKVMDVMTHGGASEYMKKGPGQAKDPKDGDRVDIMTSSDDGKTYKINVNSNAEYAKFAGKVGGLPHNLRAITTFNENTDPKTSGISEEESKRRLKAYKESLQKTDVKSGSYMRKSTYLPKQ